MFIKNIAFRKKGVNKKPSLNNHLESSKSNYLYVFIYLTGRDTLVDLDRRNYFPPFLMVFGAY